MSVGHYTIQLILSTRRSHPTQMRTIPNKSTNDKTSVNDCKSPNH